MDIVKELTSKTLTGSTGGEQAYGKAIKSLCWLTGEPAKPIARKDLSWVRFQAGKGRKAVKSKEYSWVTYQRQKQLDALEAHGFGHNGTARATRDRGVRYG